MYTATEVSNRLAQWENEGMSKPEKVQHLAQDCLGWSYVYAAAGCMCTPDNRRHYADVVKTKDIPEKYYTMIIDNCPILSKAKDANCQTCKWRDTRCFDCRGFTRWVMEQVGIQLFGGGATTQYETNSNWVMKGLVKDLPRGIVCCLFKKKEDKMSHTGLYLGDDLIIHCSGTVKTDQLSKNSTWTHFGVPCGLYSDEELKVFGITVSGSKNVPTLRRGASGAEVRKLQNLLNAVGCSDTALKVDGVFGEKTELAVKVFQSRTGLTQDGVVGPKTLAELNKYETLVHEEADQVDTDYVQLTWDYLKAGLIDLFGMDNPNAIAGIMGNLQAESGIIPENLENRGNRAMNITDEEYTAKVDDGTISMSQFATDGYGYGICQWTYRTRKADLYDYARQCNVSIGNLSMQVGFLLKELSARKSLLEKLKNAKTVLEASSAFMLDFEKPANTTEENQKKRAELGHVIYNRFMAKDATLYSDDGVYATEQIEQPVLNAYMIPADDVQKLRDAAQFILDALRIYK